MMVKHVEHSGVIQAKVENLSLEQLNRRDELVHKHGLSLLDAVAVVRGEKEIPDFDFVFKTA